MRDSSSSAPAGSERNRDRFGHDEAQALRSQQVAESAACVWIVELLEMQRMELAFELVLAGLHREARPVAVDEADGTARSRHAHRLGHGLGPLGRGQVLQDTLAVAGVERGRRKRQRRRIALLMPGPAGDACRARRGVGVLDHLRIGIDADDHAEHANSRREAERCRAGTAADIENAGSRQQAEELPGPRPYGHYRRRRCGAPEIVLTDVLDLVHAPSNGIGEPGAGGGMDTGA